MRLNSNQLDFMAKYLGDLSKILFGSIVIGFFVPGEIVLIAATVFAAGSSLAVACVLISINLLK